MGGALVIDAVRPAGEDDADGVKGADVREGGRVGLQLAVHAVFPDAPGDELVVLAAEVKDEHGLMFHGVPQF